MNLVLTACRPPCVLGHVSYAPILGHLMFAVDGLEAPPPTQVLPTATSFGSQYLAQACIAAVLVTMRNVLTKGTNTPLRW